MGCRRQNIVGFSAYINDDNANLHRYVATVDGIFEYQLNIADRKTFPVVNYR